jgi:adenine-specific DNA-methyltransferase
MPAALQGKDLGHPIHRRYFAEDLVRLRPASERRRQAASQRQGRIDANPHQIDAVMFALERIPLGGCILADEVGLGKTIEAGLVISQLLAEGASRILIIVPRPLLGQWQHELYTLFGIEAIEATVASGDLSGSGVFLIGREAAGSAAGAARLAATPPFDLCLIDEAHEVFAGIYKRFDKHGLYLDTSSHAQTAHNVRQVIGRSPVLLLTATPIQNTLAELWGLIQYIDPSGTLLGDRPTFETLFYEDSAGRTVSGEQQFELKRRLSMVVHRTLRRQAQEFLEKPFVGRRAQLFEYTMAPDERLLYDDVTNYLLRPDLFAFEGRSRQLLLLSFHRLMASSIAALARGLEGVASRLRNIARGHAGVGDDPALRDLEDDGDDGGAVGDDPMLSQAPLESVNNELSLVESFIRRARVLPHDSKAQSLIKAVQLILERPADRQKVVVFTESLTTQDYLRDLLLQNLPVINDDVTLFRGVNESAAAASALARWKREVEPEIPTRLRPSQDIAMRLALVHEFRTRSKIFISSEAGAKGLNLQFCDTLINYDLPWNPQRIEQRIGRCHRYGQKRDVTVINFLAKDNEAQRLTFEILSTKLDLFGKVLDSSDVVLQTPRSDSSEALASSLGPEFEAEVRRIWDRARSIGEVEDELRRLRDSLEARRAELERVRERTVGLIEANLDASVRDVFRQIKTELPTALAELDRDLERVLIAYLNAKGISWGTADRQGTPVIHIGTSPALPAGLRNGVSVIVGQSKDLAEVEPVHLTHPLIEAAVQEARQEGTGSFRVRFMPGETASPQLRALRGVRGRVALTRVAWRSFEREDRLIVTAVLEGAEVLRPAEVATELIQQPCEDVSTFNPPISVGVTELTEIVDEELFLEQSQMSSVDQAAFDAAMDQIEQSVADRILVLQRARARAVSSRDNAQSARDSALGSEKRAAADVRVRTHEAAIEECERQIEELESRRDEQYQRWKRFAHERRYGLPRVEHLLDAEFVIE